MTREQAIRGLGTLSDIDVAEIFLKALTAPECADVAIATVHAAKMIGDIREAERLKMKEAS